MDTWKVQSSNKTSNNIQTNIQTLDVAGVSGACLIALCVCALDIVPQLLW